MRLLSILLFIFLLEGCASSSGVLEMGPNSYSISVAASPARGGSAGAKRMAYKEAVEHCESMGKQILVSNHATNTTNYAGAGESELTFSCLGSDDTDIKSPNYD
ncbi:MAG: hypothetical protein H7A01_13995 [Hahellaceae bacterium]|nr:hypothetical protein [Hahellaceae bacterium]MCP5210167.1 hypothetical protein [Hahellaceae bacterium]